MQVSDKTLGSWTRSKNDQLSCDYDTSKNSELYRFVTFTPEYLTKGSCVSGNTHNCATYANMNVENEPRLGTLTNLNEIQRDTTNNNSMGLLTSPDVRSGGLIDPRLIQDMSILESKFEHTTRLNMPSSSLMNDHQFDAVLGDRSLTHPIPRNEIRVSSRVSRRNSFAQQCKRP